MSKSIELMTEAIELNDRLMIKQLQLKEGWTDDEICAIQRVKMRKLLDDLDKAGKIVSWDELVEMVEGDEYDN